MWTADVARLRPPDRVRSPHVPEESKEPYPADVEARFRADAAEVIARYPQKRSALLPLLHLVQSVDGYVTGRGIDLCAELLDLTTAEVSGVATFYTQYKRHPNGTYTVGVCTNTLCAVMGGDEIWDAVSEHLGIGHDETTADGQVTLERIECNAACDFAPVVMTNWEFFDNQTPASHHRARRRRCAPAGRSRRPAAPNQVGTFKEVSRVLAGFHDGLADEGVGAGPATLVGLKIAHEQGWTAPEGPRRRPGRRQRRAHGGPHRGHARRRRGQGRHEHHEERRCPRADEAEKPGAPVASTGDGVSGLAREVPSPKDTVDPEPPQESEPDAAGRAANVSARARRCRQRRHQAKTTKKKGS